VCATQSRVSEETLAGLQRMLDREDSRMRHRKRVVLGADNTLYDLKHVNRQEKLVVEDLYQEVLRWAELWEVAEWLWGKNVGLAKAEGMFITGGRKQLAHADDALATAIVVLIAVDAGTSWTLFHRDCKGRTAFVRSKPTGSKSKDEALKAASLSVHEVITRPGNLQMRPLADVPMAAGQASIFAVSTVHASPGGEGRRVLSLAFEPEWRKGGYQGNEQRNPMKVLRELHEDNETFYWAVEELMEAMPERADDVLKQMHEVMRLSFDAWRRRARAATCTRKGCSYKFKVGDVPADQLRPADLGSVASMSMCEEMITGNGSGSSQSVHPNVRPDVQPDVPLINVEENQGAVAKNSDSMSLNVTAPLNLEELDVLAVCRECLEYRERLSEKLEQHV